MPVYLCQPGFFASEPWRHGIQVYAFPFDIDNQGQDDKSSGDGKHEDEERTGAETDIFDAAKRNKAQRDELFAAAAAATGNSSNTLADQQQVAIRRIRHAEVVLVDDVCYAYGNYWLRLRWPGKGSFAGYIALVSEMNPPTSGGSSEKAFGSGDGSEGPRIPMVTAAQALDVAQTPMEPQGGAETPVYPPAPGFYAASVKDQTLCCLRTGLPFPSSPAMQLLENYDDGIAPPVALPPPSEGNPVFCRICREGIHDVEDDEPSPQKENDDDETGAKQSATSNMRQTVSDDFTENIETSPPVPEEPKIGPVKPHPTYLSNSAAAENPLLAPCECSGSMAFVHYLCVEQWRCRSRHPEARNGLNCETCGKPYRLAPPSSRPAAQAHVPLEEEWLEAMPPHVMAALRAPHIWWQIGAAIVRRRWLRPLAPILMSPLVALYCRARRLLKKRGVSRRRWACSLCRRRARWKCVRCLRSYYCSRQCQNVSWHIVHKHVCYKPARFWWSFVVYGITILAAIPGMLRDPFLYDLALSFIPISFYVMAVLGGGVATFLKKAAGLDLRGRFLEFVVVLATGWLVWVSWGLVWGFFGETDQCLGVLRGYEHEKLLALVNAVLLKSGVTWFLFVDRMISISALKPWVCTNTVQGCFSHLPHANAEMIMTDQSCRSDLSVVLWLWFAAGASLTITTLWKRRRRAARPHQD